MADDAAREGRQRIIQKELGFNCTETKASRQEILVKSSFLCKLAREEDVEILIPLLRNSPTLRSPAVAVEAAPPPSVEVTAAPPPKPPRQQQ